MAERLNLTNLQEPEPYTLTPEEEQRAIANAIEQAQKFMAYKMRKVLKTADEIAHKIAQVDWDERVDREKILALANIAKNREVWHRAQRESERAREIERAKELQSYWTYGRIYKLMKFNSVHRFGKELDETPENLQAIKALCFFIARDDRFATELGHDRLKGLLIRGNSGTGKTHLVRCCEDNGLHPIHTLTMLDITEQVNEEGKYTIQNQGKPLIYFDDVGTEEASVKHYGTTILWFKNYIESVYHKTKCFNHIILTTNLNFSGLEKQYGFRVASRMREMFNVVDLTGKDYRTQKK